MLELIHLMALLYAFSVRITQHTREITPKHAPVALVQLFSVWLLSQKENITERKGKLKACYLLSF